MEDDQDDQGLFYMLYSTESRSTLGGHSVGEPLLVHVNVHLIREEASPAQKAAGKGCFGNLR